MDKLINSAYLRRNPSHIFVFGDNRLRKGLGGAAKLRNEPNTWGFITKKAPQKHASAYFRPEEYEKVYEIEMHRLRREIEAHPERHYLVSRLGAGLANKFHIYEKVILPRIRIDLQNYDNVEFLWETDT
jgi:hypothetical protein